MNHKRRICGLMLATLTIAAMLLGFGSPAKAVAGTAPTIAITVQDTTTGEPIKNGETITVPPFDVDVKARRCVRHNLHFPGGKQSYGEIAS
jgi:hypothetical protein